VTVEEIQTQRNGNKIGGCKAAQEADAGTVARAGATQNLDVVQAV